MGKKRKRQDEFQKVKFKVGKRKPEADNATQVSFRTKAIRLPEQLRSPSHQPSQPASTRRLNVQDLLCQLHHHNASVKQGALVGLMDLLSMHPTTIDAHLSSFLSDVAAMFTDKDPTVRRATISLLQSLAPKITVKQISPFFPLVSAHLSSAMTHIIEGIQEDSLLVFDILLEEYPVLLAGRSNMLLKNFVELISHRRLSKGVKGAVRSSVWTLSVNPNRSLTSQQWSLNVLIRLNKLLQALSDNSLNRYAEGEQLFCRKSLLDPCRDFIWVEHASGQQQIEIHECVGYQMAPFSLRSVLGVKGSLDEGLSSAENLKGFIENIIPLLIECWVEASSTHLVSGSVLKPEPPQLMQQVLNIIYLLWRLCEQNDKTQKMEAWLRMKYLNDFNHFFMNHFPYFVCEPTTYFRNSKNKSNSTCVSSNGLDHLLLNLTVCDIMVSLANASTFQSDSYWLERIQKFVTEILTDGWKLNCKQLNRLLGVTWRLMLVQRNKVATERLIRAVYMLYQQKHLIFPVRSMLLKFFSRIYLKDEDFNLHLGSSKSKALSRWLSSLPVQLVQLNSRNPELSNQLIDIIHAAAARSNKELLNHLQATACQIYDPHNGTLVLLPPESQKRLVQLLYFLPCMSKDLLSCLNRCCIMGRVTSSTAVTIIGMLHTRSPFSGWICSVENSIMSDVDYFSFLFSTLAGFSLEDLSWLQNSRARPHICQIQISPVRLYLTDHDQFVHHCTVTEAVCQSLSTVPAQSQCLDILQDAINRHLAALEIIPDSMAASILRATAKLVDQAFLPSDSVQRFLTSCSCSLLFFVITLENRDDAEHAEKRDVLWRCCISFFAALPRALRLMLQSFQVSRLPIEELPVISKMLCLLLQQGQLRAQMLSNALLVQQAVQDITTSKSGDVREQWLTDLQYCFNIYLASQVSS